MNINNLGNAIASEDVVTASHPLLKSKPEKKAPQIRKSNICVRRAPQNLDENRVTHALFNPHLCQPITQSIASKPQQTCGVALIAIRALQRFFN